MDKKNILVFPCGSEVALEIYRSLEFSKKFKLFGGSSVSDHGKFAFPNYLEELPFYNDDNFIDMLNILINKYNIDAIYPAMDSVIDFFKNNESKIQCDIICSPTETVNICLSKSLTYKKLKNIISTPIVIDSIKDVSYFPIFLKPDIGYGSRGTLKANNIDEAINHLNKHPNSLILEYLPGREYTIDCFTNKQGNLLFAGSRQRQRISNGISVNTETMDSDEIFYQLANKINKNIKFCGAWFFQLKERDNGELVLMEIAARLAGSSSVYRAKGINFAELTLFNHYNYETKIITNKYKVELDRALENKYKINLDFDFVYIDFDDTLLVNDKINYKLVGLIYKYINQNKKIILLTKHSGDIYKKLKLHKLTEVFDNIIHLKSSERKSDFIKEKNSIFIDDSFAELDDVYRNCDIAVFGVNMIDILINSNEKIKI